MSRPDSKPSDVHEQHDALLVAQFAANDPLDGARQREAAQLVSTCPRCAELAADLRVVSSAVAWEPVPRRRRDFRISAEQAEKARGNSLQRFMHRLALPQANTLRPVAAGVMSLGLLFVVAANVWPDSAAEPQAAGGSAPAVLSPDAQFRNEDGLIAASPPPLPVATDVLGLSVDPPAAVDADVAAEREQAPGSFVGQDALNADAEDSRQMLDELSDFVASDELAGEEPAAERSTNRKSVAGASAPEAIDPSTEAADDLAKARRERPDLTIAPNAIFEFADRENRDGAAGYESPEVGGRLGAEAQDIAAPSESFGEGNAPTAGTLELAEDDGGIGLSTILLVVGAVLAVGGLLLFVLLWLARRTSDPLVP